MTDAGCFNVRPGHRYEPPISHGAMLLCNITTALKFYFSGSALTQVDQEEPLPITPSFRRKWLCKFLVCIIHSHIFVNNKPTFLVYSRHPWVQSMEHNRLVHVRSRLDYHGCKTSSREEATCCWKQKMAGRGKGGCGGKQREISGEGEQSHPSSMNLSRLLHVKCFTARNINTSFCISIKGQKQKYNLFFYYEYEILTYFNSLLY